MTHMCTQPHTHTAPNTYTDKKGLGGHSCKNNNQIAFQYKSSHISTRQWVFKGEKMSQAEYFKNTI